jgi:hypothetical protein
MAAPPARTELADTYPLPSNNIYRTGIGKLWDYVTTLLGATGTPADARTALAVASTSEIQAQTFVSFTTAGSSTAYTLTTVPAIAALAAGQEYDVIFHVAAGATPTLARDGLTAKALKYRDSTGAKQPITATQVPINWRSKVVYDGTDDIVRETAGLGATAFNAYLTANQTSGNTLLFDTVVQTGSAYNTGTGLFTAPVAGWYSFSTSVDWVNNTGSSVSAGISLLMNGSTNIGSMMDIGNVLPTGLSASRSASVAAIKLAAGDTVKSWSTPTLSATLVANGVGGHISSFSGCYLGA